jgi:hypothetical protein
VTCRTGPHGQRRVRVWDWGCLDLQRLVLALILVIAGGFLPTAAMALVLLPTLARVANVFLATGIYERFE